MYDIQKRIYKASLAKKKGTVIFLQNKIINSIGAKCIAVRQVTTENKGKKTPGIDGKVYLTSKEKASLAATLEIDGKASSIKRVLIPKKGSNKLRALGILTIRDRAKQRLVLMALEPEWEAKFEPNSYGFRPGRNAHDAVEAIFNSLRNRSGRGSGYKKYVLDADLKGCFDRIDHEYLLSKLKASPKITKQIKAWLKAGI